MEKKDNVYIRDDFISIADDEGEVVRWVRDEWLEEPDIVVTIGNAINLASEEDNDGVRKILEEYYNKGVI